MRKRQIISLAVALLFPLSQASQAQYKLGQKVEHKFTWLMENVEVKGIVRWIDPKNTCVEPPKPPTEPDELGLEPDPNYRHLIGVMPGNNPLQFESPGSPGVLLLETYPLEDSAINLHRHWSLPKKPENLPFEVIINPATGENRPLAVGDHIRVVGRWVIDHHPEWCDICSLPPPSNGCDPGPTSPKWCTTVNPKPFRCRNLLGGIFRTGLAHVELHPFRWDDIQLVDPKAELARNAAFETLSLAAPLHEELFLSAGKWLGNAPVERMIYINDFGANYHSTMTATANIRAPALPSGFAGDPSLVAYQETVLENGTGLEVDSVRSIQLTPDGILVNTTINAPRTLSTFGSLRPELPVAYADMNDPAKGKSIFQARYMVSWLRRLRIIDANGVPYDTDNPFNPATIQLPLTAVGSTPFLVYAQTRGPSTVVIKSVTVESDAEGAFEMAPVNGLSVPPGYVADLQGNFKPSHPGTLNAKLVILSNDPGNERIEIGIQGKAVELQGIKSPP